MSAPAVTTFEIVAGSGGALAAIHITADSEHACDSLVRRLRLGPLPAGAVALRDLSDIDTAIAARPSPTAVILTPHASPLVITRVARWLTRADIPHRAADPRARYPEARDYFEACMLDALAGATSPLAIDALLRQPDLWRARRREPDPTHDKVLARLLTPPLVVAIGHANIGKSTLVNALARRTVALAADQPGTTRDHVGVALDLAGLVVRWIDTPGFPRGGAVACQLPADPIESEALTLARVLIADADLILSCADASAPFLNHATLPIRPTTPILTCATRADVAPPPIATVTTAAARLQGLDALATAIRETLLPPATLESETPWRFHPALPSPAPPPEHP